jgi:hypothetical protein
MLQTSEESSMSGGFEPVHEKPSDGDVQPVTVESDEQPEIGMNVVPPLLPPELPPATTMPEVQQ